MASTGRAGRISATVLGVGIGAAVVAGGWAPSALADDTGGGAGDSASSSDTSASPAGESTSPTANATDRQRAAADAADAPTPAKPEKPTKKTAAKADRDRAEDAAAKAAAEAADPSDPTEPQPSTGPVGEDAGSGPTAAEADATAEDHAPKHKRSAGAKTRPSQIESVGPAHVTDTDAAPSSAPAPDAPTSPEPQTDAAEDTPAEVPIVTEVTLTEPEPVTQNTETAETGAETTVIQAVAANTSTANPAGSPVSPATPVALTQLWTAAAATRRVIESASATTEQVLPSATDTTSEPVAEAVPTATVNSQSPKVRRDVYRQLGLAYTAPPTLSEQLATFVTDSVASVVHELTTFVTRLVTPVVNSVASVALDLLYLVSKITSGPPVLPPGSTVKVGTSTLKISETITVPANWYFPEGDQPPDRLIWLQHGVGPVGPMYSYTAAWLAENTHSIVVTPSITSNWLAPGGNGTPGSGLWVGGDAMHELVAELFLGDRPELTASALDAGYATQYGLDPLEMALPRSFGLVGHSAGGALASGVAGFLVDNGAAAELVGVILLDGVPHGDQLPSALRKLADYQQLTDRYIPIREIGAPDNAFNKAGNAIPALTAARPDHFNGVVLAGGAHSDAMQGGNPIIQFAVYLFAGFPKARNQAAVQTLMADWFNDWFAGDVTSGDELAPGSAVQIDTPEGTATGTVIGTPTTVSV